MAQQGGTRRRSGIIMIQSEATPGVDPGSWAVATHAIVAYEVSFNALDQANIFEREPLAPDFIGTQTPIPGIHTSRCTLRVPLVGSGDNTSIATLIPDWEPLALAGNLVRDATNDVTGPPAERAYKTSASGTSVAIKLQVGPASDIGGSNWTEYLLLGGASTIKIVGGSNGEPAMLEFDVQGSYNEPAPIAAPSSPTLVEVSPQPFLGIGCSWTPNGLTHCRAAASQPALPQVRSCVGHVASASPSQARSHSSSEHSRCSRARQSFAAEVRSIAVWVGCAGSLG